MEVADKHGLVVIEDAAHSVGAKYRGEMVGSIADITTFSVHPVKHITTGEGGMVMTDDKELYEKLREKNIGVNIHYIPAYYFLYYEKLGYEKGICTVAENFYETIITLSLHSGITEEEVDYVMIV